jgi:DNA polymerase-3 subunit alpha
MNIIVYPPDINQSGDGFSIVDAPNNQKAIRFGLSGVKNVGKAAIDNILESRKNGSFVSLDNFLGQTDSRKINKKVLESLIKVGALSTFGNRATLLTAIEDLKRLKRASNPNQNGLFAETEITSGTDLSKYQKEEIADEELEAFENQLLGFSLSGRSVIDIIGRSSNLATIHIVDTGDELQENTKQKIVAVLKNVKEIVTKKSNQKMAFIEVDDGTGTLEAVVFPSLYAEMGSKLQTGLPLLLGGEITKRDEDISFIVNEITTLGKNTTLNLPTDLPADKLKGLKNLLDNHPGEVEIYINMEGTEEPLLFPHKVNWTKKLAQEVNQLLVSQ